MNWNTKKKKWQMRHCQKMRKKKKKSGGCREIEGLSRKKVAEREYYQTRDIETLSIHDNTEETYAYFNDIIDEIKKKNKKEKFFFNLTGVEKLNIDAIMYILAILRNIKDNIVYKYSFAGNQPTNKEANALLRRSGFFDYVKTKSPFLKTDSDDVKIKTGNTVDVSVVKYICDYINEKCATKMLFTAELYEMLIELMTNTVQHAYNDKNVLTTNQWYIYVGNEKKYFSFVFLDTGAGIPQTVNKKAMEKFGELFVKKDDSYYLKSALNGEWRSSTAETYRGKGLPSIVEYTEREEVKGCRVYSGHGMCKVNKKNEECIKGVDFGNKLFGTLICWKIDKNKIGEMYYE